MKESARAKLAWADYLALGEGRSFEKLLQCYHGAINRPPTTRLKSLADWSRLFGWQRRLADLADAEAQRIAEEQAAYRRAIMQEGFALDYERVKSLKAKAERLSRLLDGLGDQEYLTLPAPTVQVVLAGLRGVFDDIAKEKGERAANVRVAGPNGGDIPIRQIVIESTKEGAKQVVIEGASDGRDDTDSLA